MHTSRAEYQKQRYTKRPPAKCHPERKDHAGGHCRSCYRKGARAPKAICHPDRFHVAKGMCTECYNAQPERKARQIMLRRVKKYGLSEQDYDRLLDQQKGLCAICQMCPVEHIDHDHQTGQVRGLLCGNCNSGLGMLKDDTGLLSKASFYLRKADYMGKRIGDFIQTVSGRQFWPLDPRPEEIYIEDIAHALSHQCRFAGHTRVPYTVAEHSVRVSKVCPPEHALVGLLHDATEAYLVDVPTPVKRFLSDYQLYEARLYDAVAERFGLPEGLPLSVVQADRILLATEKRDLMRPAPAGWGELPEPLAERIVPLPTPGAIRKEFLTRFYELGGT